MTVRTHTEDRYTVVSIDGRELARTTRPRIAARLVARLIDHRPPLEVGTVRPAADPETADLETSDGRTFDLTADALEALRRVVDGIAAERLARLPQPDPTYCDNCGETVGDDARHYSAVPFPVASANAGESATVCPACDPEEATR